MPSLRSRLHGLTLRSKRTSRQELPLASTTVGDGFFNGALQLLEPRHRAVIVEFGLSNPSSDISTILDNAYKAAHQKKVQSEERQWMCTINGHEIRVAVLAEKVLRWLNRFKTIADVASNANPVLAGLPWVGIRVLLEVALFDRHRMAALLQGLETAFYVVNRLRAYLEYFAQLPESTARSNFQNSLTRFYAFLLRFFADAIRTLDRGTITRAFDAFFSFTTSSDSFEVKFQEIARQVDIEADMCDRVRGEQQLQVIEQSRVQLNDCLREIRELHDAINLTVDLSKLPRADGAAFDSFEEETGTYCLPNTRADLLEEIWQWSRNPDGKRIFWLCGMAGTGKSTLARTVARRVSDSNSSCRLAASFFFKRGEGDRGTAKRFFTTLAAQLSYTVPGFQQFIAETLNENPDISGRSIREQFEKLIVEPLARAEVVLTTPIFLLIIVDALDECDDEGRIKNILFLLGNAIITKRLRLFVTSRPELPIRLEFAKMKDNAHQDFILHEIESSTIEHDLTIYFQHELSHVRDTWRLPLDWPSQDDIHDLVQLAKPLFIFAATVCKFISGGRSDPRSRLKRILEQHTSLSDGKLKQTYLTVLEQLDSESEHINIKDEIHELIAPLVVLETPLSIDSISSLLGLQSDDVAYKLESYHSVLMVPTDRDGLVRFLHLSFSEFICASEDSNQHRFALDERKIHKLLATRCLETMSRPGTLKMDLCSLGEPGIRRSTVDQNVIRSAVSPAVLYACQYWVHHIVRSGQRLSDDDEVHVFLKQHLIHWLEALSWHGRVSESIEQITRLNSLVDTSKRNRLYELLDDAYRFALYFRNIIDLAPLQLYSSALIFAPKNSIVRNLFQGDMLVQLRMMPEVFVDWTAELMQYDSRSGITSIAFSPCGNFLAAGYNQGDVKLWKAATGEERQSFEYAEISAGVVSICFPKSLAPRNQTLIAGYLEGIAVEWDVATGKELRRYGVESADSTVLAFSSDCRLVASEESRDSHKLLRIFNVEDNHTVLDMDIIGTSVDQVSFSHDGKFVVVTNEETIWLSDLTIPANLWQTGLQDAGIICTSISQDNTLVASGSGDGVVTIRKAATGQNLRHLRPSPWSTGMWPSVIAFSTDDRRVCAAYQDGIIVWGLEAGQQVQTFDGHEQRAHFMSFSSFGGLVASASRDETIRIWRIIDSQQKQTPTSPDRKDEIQRIPRGVISYTAFSPDSQTVIAGGYGVSTLWSVSTGRKIRTIPVTFPHDAFDSLSHQLIAPRSPGCRALWNIAMSCSATYIRDLKAVSGDGRIMALSDGVGNSRLEDISTRQVISTIDYQHDSRLRALFSPNSELMALYSDSTLSMWQISMSQPASLMWFSGQRGIGLTSFSSDGTLIAGAHRCSLKLWESLSGEEIEKVDLDDPITSIAFSPDTQLIALTTVNALYLWDIALARITKRVTGAAPARFSSFALDGHHLLTNLGPIDLPCNPREVGIWHTMSSRVFRTYDWIKYNGQDIIWLPYDYRGSNNIARRSWWTDYGRSTSVRDNIVAIGQCAGFVTIIDLNV